MNQTAVDRLIALLGTEESVTLKIDKTDSSSIGYVLDYSTLVFYETSNYIFRITYQSYDEILIPLPAVNEISTIKLVLSSEEVPLSTTNLILDTAIGRNPPGDHLIPLFQHAGDRIVVNGVGSVLIADIEDASSAGLPIMLRSDGTTFRVLSSEVDKRTLSYTLDWEAAGEQSTRHDESVYSVARPYIYILKRLELPGVSTSSQYRVKSIDIRNATTAGTSNKVGDTAIGMYYIEGPFYDANPQLHSDPLKLSLGGLLQIPKEVHTGLVAFSHVSNLETFPTLSTWRLPYLLGGRTTPQVQDGDRLLVLLANTNGHNSGEYDATDANLTTNRLETELPLGMIFYLVY